MEKRLRILVTAFDYVPRLGGLANCAHELACALAAQPGVEVKVLAPAQAGSEPFDRNQPFATRRIRLPRGSYRAILPLALAIRGELRRWDPDLILDTVWSPCSQATRLALCLAPGRARKQAILVHGVEVLESRRTWRKWIRFRFAFLKRLVFRGSCFVLPVSRFTARMVLLHCGVGREKIHQIFNGVNTREFHPAPSSLKREDFGLLAHEKVLFCLARLEDYKGVDYALRALARLKDKPVKLLVGGTGPDLPRLRRLSGELGVDAKVAFLGKVPQERLRDHYNFCDAFLLLSRIDWHSPQAEGFGLVYLEAAACRKASIAPVMGGPLDAVIHGQTGLLVDPTDTEEIAAAMDRLLFEPGLAARLADNAFHRVQAQYRWETVARSVVERSRQPCAE